MKVQADKVNRARVWVHILRQRRLGERMSGELNYSRIPETLAATAGLLAMLVYSAHRGWL